MMLRQRDRSTRDGAVAVEMAIVLPFIMFLAAIGVDYARIFSRTMILETASRNACWWAAQDPVKAADTAGIRAVALRDLTDMTPTPTVTSSTYVGADGFSYVKVTVSATFTTFTSVPGVRRQSDLSRSTDMRICPTTPRPGTY
ncbi:MAG TPA: TadE family protein [Gemmataceae bacterium]|nr:TadE family protein [Gemmataceae bacterium]